MSIEAMKLALEALEEYQEKGAPFMSCDSAVNVLRQAIEEAEKQEPVAWQERQARRMKDGVVTEWTNWYPCRYRTIDEARAEACDHIPYEWRPLYTHPPKREWVSLTEEEIQELHYQIKVKCIGAYRTEDVYRAIEAKLREKNT